MHYRILEGDALPDSSATGLVIRTLTPERRATSPIRSPPRETSRSTSTPPTWLAGSSLLALIGRLARSCSSWTP